MPNERPIPADWKAVRAGAYFDLIGPLLRPRAAEERNTFGLQTDQSHVNPIGIVHGGVLASLLDQAIAIVAWEAADRQPTVTVQIDTRFLGVAKVGDFLEARATVRHATRTLTFVDAEITSPTGPVASASAIMKITPQRETKT